MTSSAANAGVATALLLSLCACTEGKKPDVAAASASVSAAPPAPSASASASAVDAADELRPVYPTDAGPPDPLAERYCDAIYGEPVRRRVECCGPVVGAAAEMGGQCVRVVTAALASRAITIDPAAIDRCAAAVKQSAAGCDWVTPYGSLPIPPACDGVIKGALGDKARCRSSLECADGLRCQGLSTIDVGRCGPPKPAGAECNLAVDMLVTLSRQDRFDRAHPECAGYCAGRRCEATLAEGAACKSDVQCGKARCGDGKCTSAPPPRAGEACSSGLCAEGLHCVQGKCVAPHAEGDPCAADGECRGACVRGDAGPGTCTKSCTPPPWPKLSPPAKR